MTLISILFFVFVIQECVFSSSRQTWSKLSVEGVEDRIHHAACSVRGDFLYIIGGDSRDGEFVNEIIKYSFIFQEWTKLDLSLKLIGHAISVVNNNIYIFGGETDFGDLSTAIYRIDENDDLTKVKYSLNENDFFTGMSSHSASSENEKIYYYGGTDDKLLIFDTITHELSSIDLEEDTPMLYLHSSIIHNHKLYLFGGFDKRKSDLDLPNEYIHILDLSTLKWVDHIVMEPEGVYNIRSSTKISHYAYLIGEEKKEPQEHYIHIIFDFENNEFPKEEEEKIPNNMIINKYHCSFEYDQELYIFGSDEDIQSPFFFRLQNLLEGEELYEQVNEHIQDSVDLQETVDSIKEMDELFIKVVNRLQKKIEEDTDMSKYKVLGEKVDKWREIEKLQMEMKTLQDNLEKNFKDQED